MRDGTGRCVKRMSREMSRKRLRVLSIVGPLAGLAALYPVRLVAQHAWSTRISDILVGLLMLLGVLMFSQIIFGLIERQDARLAAQRRELATHHDTERRLRAQMEALHEAALTISSTDTARDILQHLVDLAREIIGTRYGALGVLGPQEAIGQLYTSGVAPKVTAWLGPLPQGHGLLHAIQTNGTAPRVADLREHAEAAGLPPNYPGMRSLLAVPVQIGGHIVGNLSLADRVDGLPFSEEDERLLVQLAGHVAAIVHQARLAEEVRRLAAAAERDRLRTTLRDNVIQRIFALRLSLEGAEDELPTGAASARAEIEHAIDQLGLVMEEVRLAIVGNDAARATALNGKDAGGRECHQSG
jgi:nitrate/nitrite-specific signal transduction histidine kinase